MVESNDYNLFSALVDTIQKKGLHVKRCLLDRDCWTIRICFKSKRSGKIRFYRFTYDNRTSAFNIEKRRFLRYQPVKKIEIRDTDNITEISKQALEIASSTS